MLHSGAGCRAALAWLRMAAFAFILDFYCDRRACIRVLRVCSATGPGLWMSAPQAVALGSWSSFFLSYFSSWIQAALCSGFPSVSVLKFGKWRGERLTLLFSSILEAVFWHRDTKLSGAWPVLLFFALRPRNAGLLPAPRPWTAHGAAPAPAPAAVAVTQGTGLPLPRPHLHFTHIHHHPLLPTRGAAPAQL